MNKEIRRTYGTAHGTVRRAGGRVVFDRRRRTIRAGHFFVLALNLLIVRKVKIELRNEDFDLFSNVDPNQRMGTRETR